MFTMMPLVSDSNAGTVKELAPNLKNVQIVDQFSQKAVTVRERGAERSNATQTTHR